MVDTRIERARELRRTMTDAERRLWSLLRNRSLGFKFRRQVPIGRYIADFACVEARVVVELDGGQHAESAADVERDASLRAHGYRVVRIWNPDVIGNPQGVAELILDSISNGPSP